MTATKSSVRIPTTSGQTLNTVAVLVRETEAGYECSFDRLSPVNASWMTAEEGTIGKGETEKDAKADFVRQVLAQLQN